MSIKQTPVNYRTYYKLFIEQQSTKRDELIANKEVLVEELKESKKQLVKDINVYKNRYNVYLPDYPEFYQNKYIDGNLGKVAKGLYFNKKENYTATTETLNLFVYTNKLKDVYDIENQLIKINKLCLLTLKEYNHILKTYYNKVHELMVLEGYGYAPGNGLGWLCINRCTRNKNKKVLDFAATKQREKELTENGERIYNKEEADWCKANGIEYDGKDKRVYLTSEYLYEIAWIKPNVKDASKYKFEPVDSRGSKIRGLSNKNLLEQIKNIKEVFSLPIDLKTKLNLCIELNKHLYFKFIRNEAQKSIAYKSSSR